MPRKRPAFIPAYRKRAGRNTAFVEYKGSRVPLGVHGTAESLAAYERFRDDLLAGREPSAVCVQETAFVAGVVAGYLDHAKEVYGDKERGEYANIKSATALLLEFCGAMSSTAFGPKALDDFQEWMKRHHKVRRDRNGVVVWRADRPVMPSYVNWVSSRIKRVFRWAERREFVAKGTWFSLRAVPGLRTNKRKKRPVREAHFLAVLAEVSPMIAAMLRIQWHTSARSGSVCRARRSQFEIVGDLWYWRPRHKQEHTGEELIVPIGPRLQGALRPFIDGCEARDYIFSPRRIRNNPRYRQRYRVQSYRQAVTRGIERANAKRGIDEQIPRFTPHQLRHSRIRIVRDKHGAEAAQSIAGHKSLAATQLYSGRRLKLAKRVARESG